MRIIDIDLDFFLDDIDHGTRYRKRLSDKEFNPWNENDVVQFLESQCGLKAKKIPGRYVEEHHEALFFWIELISKEKLITPFEVVHIDAHADLGMGDAAYVYIMNDLLHVAVGERKTLLVDEKGEIQENGKKVNEGNYLAFAIALRFVSQLKYVTHEIVLNTPIDIPHHYIKDNTIQMKATVNYNPILLNSPMPIKSYEPEVPLEKISKSEFQDNGNFDFIVLSHSPAYTPKSSDVLIPIIKNYILEI